MINFGYKINTHRQKYVLFEAFVTVCLSENFHKTGTVLTMQKTYIMFEYGLQYLKWP